MKELHHCENLKAEDVVFLWELYQCSLQELQMWLVGESSVAIVIDLTCVLLIPPLF